MQAARRSELAQVANRPSADIATQLEAAVQQGFLQVVREAGEDDRAEPHRTYRWTHDRVQQAAYSMFDRPRMTDPAKLAASDLLVAMMPTARIAEPYLFALLALKYVELSLAHGFAANSPFAYANFSVVLYRFHEDIDKSFRFAKLARRLLTRFNRPEMGARANATLVAFLDFWRESLASLIPGYRLGIAVETEYGSLQYAGYATLSQVAREIASSAPLGRIAEELSEGLVLAKRAGNRLALQPLQRFDCLVVSLRGQASGSALPAAASADEVLSQLGARADESARFE
jgi:predicted ATPase